MGWSRRSRPIGAVFHSPAVVRRTPARAADAAHPPHKGEGKKEPMSITRARQLRKALTPQEARLWTHLRILRKQGFHIRRQAPFRGYYLDFACFDRRLVIEIDGGQHALPEGERHDAVRDAVLKREGFRVLRFWNAEVNDNFDGVMETIFRALTEAIPSR